MCGDENPSPEAMLRNLRADMPLWRKMWLFMRNNARKILRLKGCCGNHGEPGC
jgi:hypothetical protein